MTFVGTRHAGAVYGEECVNLSRSPASGSVRESRRNLADQGCADGTILSHYTYVLLFVLGSALFFQGTTHMLRETSLFDLALSNPARIGANLVQSFPGAWLCDFL